jgi:hypothetical protein
VKNPRIPLAAPLLLALLCAPSLLAQSGPAKEASLRIIGRKTINAIASGNSDYISSIVDPNGILVGYDGVKHSADSFRKDLVDHVGLYCDLFENGCRTKHNPGYTLGYVLRSGGRPSDADLKSKINGNDGTIEYWEFGGAGDLISTLSYRFAGGRWLLYNIHFV